MTGVVPGAGVGTQAQAQAVQYQNVQYQRAEGRWQRPLWRGRLLLTRAGRGRGRQRAVVVAVVAVVAAVDPLLQQE